jgi:hypothetical protein
VITAAGDANCDTVVTAADVPALLTTLATGDTELCGADTDCNRRVDAADVAALVSELFAGSPPVPCPD